MDSCTCKHCWKTFATKYTCRRHMNICSANQSIGESDSDEDSVASEQTTVWHGIEQDDAMEQSYDSNDQTSEADTEAESLDKGDDNEITDHESESSQESDADLDGYKEHNDAWRRILNMFFTFTHTEDWFFQVNKSETFLKEPHLRELISWLSKMLQILRETLDTIDNTDLWKAIQETQDQLILEDNFKPNEAYTEAWFNQKTLVREMLRKNLPVLDKWVAKVADIKKYLRDQHQVNRFDVVNDC